MVLSSPRTPWIQYWRQKPQARLRLFCFPYAGGSASLFRSFPELLPADIEVWPVQLPGRENRFIEAPFTHMDDLILALEQALLPYLDVPYAFFGHSMGALISFEFARRLRRNHRVAAPTHLFVSGRQAAHINLSGHPLHLLPDSVFIQEIRRLKGTPEEILNNDCLLRVFLPLLRADFMLCENYVYKYEKPFSFPITAFGGLQDEDVPREALNAWGEHTSDIFKAHFFAGNHFFLHKEQKQEALLKTLSEEAFRYDLCRLHENSSRS